MHKIINEIIKKIYFEKDYNFFIQKSRIEVKLPFDFVNFINNSTLKITEVPSDNNPCLEFYVVFKNTHVGEFKAKYSSILKISKIINSYYIDHQFEVENIDIERLSPKLYGAFGEPYIKPQLEFDQQVSEILDHNGYLRLYYRDMEEVVEGLKMPEDVTLFGPQVTVETALFRDVFELVPDEES